MRNWLAHFLALVFLLAQTATAPAWFIGGGELQGFWVGGGGGPATITFTDVSDNSANLTTYSFTSQSLGTADDTRVIIVVVHHNPAAGPIVSVTVAGISAAFQARNSSFGSEIWTAEVPTGTTGTIDVELSSAGLRCQIGVWAAYDLESPTATDSAFDEDDSDPASTTAVDIQAGGVAVAGSNTNANTTTTWAGLTEDFDAVVEAVINGSGASGAFATLTIGPTISADFAAPGPTNRLVVAAFR